MFFYLPVALSSSVHFICYDFNINSLCCLSTVDAGWFKAIDIYGRLHHRTEYSVLSHNGKQCVVAKQKSFSRRWSVKEQSGSGRSQNQLSESRRNQSSD